jgi:AraC-like DNA-binding protein/mannose-6-phosphate isomerase-like protein (cupin superfamily)
MMLINADSSVNYDTPGVWDSLAALLEHTIEPRPTTACGRVECAPDWRWRPCLNDYDLWFAIKGRGQMQIANHTYAIQAGSLLFLRPGDAGWAIQDHNDRLTVIYVHLDFYTPRCADLALVDGAWLPSRYIPFTDPTSLEQLLTRVVRLTAQNRRFAALEARIILQQALLDIYRQDAIHCGAATSHLDSRLERVVTRLRNNPETRLSLEQAAALSNLSPAYFSRLFTREMGKSFRAFALETRLERARYLLEETDLPIGEIARSLGYDDVFLFSRQFKQRYNYSPSRLRK